MQKIAFALIALILFVSFYFIQKDDNKINSTSHTNTETKTVTLAKEEEIPVIEPQVQSPFTPNISTQNIKRKASESQQINEIEPKSDLEMQKVVLLDMQDRITTEMKNIPNCLENADSKEEALKCNQHLQELHKEFELLLGIDNNVAPDNMNNFIWNETTKENLIKELEDSIQPMQEMYTCLQTAETQEEQDKCFEVDENIEEDTISL